jgi:hypothetical protein
MKEERENASGCIPWRFQAKPGRSPARSARKNPLRTKKSPSGLASIPLHLRNTGSGLRWQVTTQTDLPSTGLYLRIDAGARAIAKPVADHLREMKHELVVIFELIVFDADHRAIIGHANQEVAALGIEKCGDGL